MADYSASADCKNCRLSHSLLPPYEVEIWTIWALKIPVWHMAPSDFGRSVKPISTRGERLCSSNYTGTPEFSDLLRPWTLVHTAKHCQFLYTTPAHFLKDMRKFNWYLHVMVHEITNAQYRHSLIYTVNVGTHKKTTECKNRSNRGYLLVLKENRIEL
jgi:hypothetical protein